MQATDITFAAEAATARPPVLRATRELGIRDIDVAGLLGVTAGQVGDWTNGKRPIPHVRHVAILFMVTRLLGIVGEPPEMTAKHAARLKAAREAAQRWAELARDELANLPDSVLEAGADLGNEIMDKLDTVIARRGT